MRKALQTTALFFKTRILFFFICATLIACLYNCNTSKPEPNANGSETAHNHYPLPDTSKIPNDKTGEEIRYGLMLFTKTAKYLGPEGKLAKITGNKMNCKNCHLDQGRRIKCNNLIETYLKYPQYRSREGMVLTIEDRVNNCFERPMNGKMLAYDSREMRAIVAYIRWLSEGHVASFEDDTMHLGKIALIDRAADPIKGQKVFEQRCVKCHGEDGQGRMDSFNIAYEYPPLWGPNSYAMGSSMHRVITASRFIKWAMPYEQFTADPVLSNEEAFDVASYINNDTIHPRPYRPLEKDCPDLENKPIDFPFGPFLDTFSIKQHKYGPFKPIKEFYANRKKDKK